MAEQTKAGRGAKKSANAFRTISEVAVELDLPQHVLRFWESKFSQITGQFISQIKVDYLLWKVERTGSGIY